MFESVRSTPKTFVHPHPTRTQSVASTPGEAIYNFYARHHRDTRMPEERPLRSDPVELPVSTASVNKNSGSSAIRPTNGSIPFHPHPTIRRANRCASQEPSHNLRISESRWAARTAPSRLSREPAPRTPIGEPTAR